MLRMKNQKMPDDFVGRAKSIFQILFLLLLPPRFTEVVKKSEHTTSISRALNFRNKSTPAIPPEVAYPSIIFGKSLVSVQLSCPSPSISISTCLLHLPANL